MSNFINLAMQNRAEEEMRKRRRKEEMSNISFGGYSDGEGSSKPNSSFDETVSNSSPLSYVSPTISNNYGIGDLIGDIAEEYISEKIEDKIKEKITKEVGEKVGKEVAEKVGKEALEKVGKKVAETGVEKLFKKLSAKSILGVIGSIASLHPGVRAVMIGLTALSALMDIKDLADIGLLVTTGKDLGEHTDENVEEFKRKREEDKKKKEEDKKKQMVEAEKAKKQAEEKLKKEEEEKRKREEELAKQEAEKEQEEDEEEDEGEEAKSDSSLKKGAKKGIMHTLGTIGGSVAVTFAMTAAYRTHYTGEFEYKGISAEYQNEGIDSQNFTTYDKNGDVVLTGLSKENKLMKTFYTKYSDKSYYAIVEDSEKYKNIDDAYKRKNLLTPDELRKEYPEIEDVNGREVMFQLNPDVLYVLDKYIHQDTVLYPQQFVKPVYYEESKDKFALKDLMSDNGEILAKSQEFDRNGKPLKDENGNFKKVKGIWDYGFAPIIRYKEYEVLTRKIDTGLKREVEKTVTQTEKPEGKIVKKAPESGSIPDFGTEIGKEKKRKEPAYIIDKVVTPGGTVENEIEKKWVKDPDSVQNYENTQTVSVKVGEKKKPCPVEELEPDKDPGTDIILPDYGGAIPVAASKEGDKKEEDKKEEDCGTIDLYDVYVITDYYETYVEEELPQYKGEPSTEGITGSEYFRDYMSSYSNYFPSKLPTRLDFRVLDNPEIKDLIYDDDPLGLNGTPSNPSLEEGTEGENEGEETTENESEEVVVTRNARTPDNLMNNYNAVQTRNVGLIMNQGGNAVTNYGMTIEEYTEKRFGALSGCANGTCSLTEYREHVEPMAFRDKFGDLRHLRVDVYRPVNENVFIKMLSERFKTFNQYGAEMIEAAKQANVDVVGLASQLAEEGGWGDSAIVGVYGGKTYYNFAGINANDSNPYGGGLQYAVKMGWDSPLKGMVGAVKWIAAKYMHNPEHKQNTYYKVSMPYVDVNHFYASNPSYAHNVANIMQNSIIRRYPDIYPPNTQFYFDFPEFDPNKPKGTIEGAGYVPGGGMSSGGTGTPATAFNSYLASNWSGIESKWDELFPGQSELDETLDIVKKGDYTELYENYEKQEKYRSTPGLKSKSSNVKTIPRNNKVYDAKLTAVDKELTLNMMFALNQGNYMFKYDNMSEIEWKAMYTQLLSSPTGKEWDDKWIGFSKKDIFGIDDVGKLFKEGANVSPVISVPYGMTKNLYSSDTNISSQFNFMNFGIDIVVPPETEVLTVADGEVISVSKKNDINSRYGNYVEIKHANDTVTLTANLKEVKVKVGDKLKKGDVIGTSGGECKSYKDNALHYQIRHKGQLINPTWIITGEMTGFEDPITSNNGVMCNNTVSAPSNNQIIDKVIEIAKQQIGKPYVYGAEGPDTFDCSGFMYYIMKEAGIDTDRKTAEGFYESSTEIKKEEIMPGDLIFWHDLVGDKRSSVYHVGIYMGNDEIIDCSPDHNGVGTRKLSELKETSSRKFTYGRYTPLSGSSTSSPVGNMSAGCQMPGTNMDNGTYIWPVPGTDEDDITSHFGVSRDNGTKIHKGMDIGGTDYGAPIVASRAGKVIKTKDGCATDGYYGSNCGGGFGNYVFLEHEDGMVTIYPHMSKGSLKVKVGDTVSQGQELGGIGNSGSSMGKHLHFEMRKDGKTAVQPLDYLTSPPKK